MLQVVSFKIPFTSWWAGGQGLQYGTGVISVAGISFTFLTTAQGSIKLMMAVLTASAFIASTAVLLSIQGNNTDQPHISDWARLSHAVCGKWLAA